MAPITTDAISRSPNVASGRLTRRRSTPRSAGGVPTESAPLTADGSAIAAPIRFGEQPRGGRFHRGLAVHGEPAQQCECIGLAEPAFGEAQDRLNYRPPLRHLYAEAGDLAIERLPLVELLPRDQQRAIYAGIAD